MMLRKRIVTAIFLIPLTLVVLIYLPPVSFFILTGFITLCAAWEWTNLMEIKNASNRFIYVVLMVFMLLLATLISISSILFLTLIWWLLASLCILFYPQGSDWWKRGFFWRGLMGMMVLVPCWVAINFIRYREMGITTLVFLLVLVCGADSVAYFIGRKWGKHRLIPSVSPGKSWEGLAGALVYAVVITCITLWAFHVPGQLTIYIILLSLVTVIFSVIGDLFESMLKRQAGLKDSSNLLPGHGGLLDRMDSLTAALPIFAFGANLLGSYIK